MKEENVQNYNPKTQNLILQRAISELLFVSVSKWVLVLNYCKGNEFDLHKNTQLISIWMVVHQDSLWNWGIKKLGNGLLNCHVTNGQQNNSAQKFNNNKAKLVKR